MKRPDSKIKFVGTGKSGPPRKLALLTLAGFWAFSLFLPAIAQMSSDDLARLKGMEEKLFFKNYEDGEVESRITRLEKKVFGDQGEGSLAERFAKLKELIKPEIKETPKKPNIDLKAVPNKTVPSNSQQPSQSNYQGSNDDLMDRKRRAMLAKEEEVSQLQAEAVELWKARKGQEAIEKFQQVLRLAPDYAEAHFSMGVIYEAARRYGEALDSYKRALALNPGKREYQEAVSSLGKKAEKEQAEQGEKAELKELAMQASAAYKRGEYNSALGFYKELDSKAPRQAMVKYNIATIYLALKNPVDALDYFKQAYKIKPDDERYKEAVEKLSANLKQAQQEREEAEATYDDAAGKTNKAVKGGNLAGRGSTQASAAYGILTKKGDGGVEITAIAPQSRADRAGLKKGDIIKAVDGTITENNNALNDMLKRKQLNEGVQMIIQRGAKIGQFVM
ncbi:MAG: tetratricopeptide repeat protein [Candidatus Obscuribacterales bacterium]|nr:tetratricopeptide repeat protein [Candidatus Obscuribacterales bacterium]